MTEGELTSPSGQFGRNVFSLKTGGTIMTPSQLKYRADLLTRHDAALYRWPQGKSPEFIREVTAIADDLETLALEADAVGGDQLERFRTWRYVGNAYQDLSVGQGGNRSEKQLTLIKGLMNY